MKSNTPHDGDESARLGIIQRRMVVVALGLFIAFLTVQVAQIFSDILRILSIAIFVCYTVVSLVDWLEHVTKSRIFAVLAVYAFGAVVTVISVIIVIPILVYQISSLVQSTFDQIPTFLEWSTKILTPLEVKLNHAHIYMKPSDMLANFAAAAPKPDAGLIVQHVTNVAMSTMTWFFYAMSVLILSFYFLLDGGRMSRAIVDVFPDTLKSRMMSFVRETDKTLHSFFKGQIVLGLLFGAFMVAVYWALGVPYALALGIILGMWEVVPVIGPTLGFAPTVLAVLVHGIDHVPASRFVQLLIVVAVFAILQWLKDNIVAPKYIGNVIGLHPVIIFIAIMIGARLDGMLGIIVSLPVACMINVFVKHLKNPELQEPVAVAAGLSSPIDGMLGDFDQSPGVQVRAMDVSVTAAISQEESLD
ncbi:MAG: AI-2E family transporter [Candidatus Obscuribacterales bacterium]|nr:AI-2E family transporter [Candidatus Obscuribacterales bacterium]